MNEIFHALEKKAPKSSGVRTITSVQVEISAATPLTSLRRKHVLWVQIRTAEEVQRVTTSSWLPNCQMKERQQTTENRTLVSALFLHISGDWWAKNVTMTQHYRTRHVHLFLPGRWRFLCRSRCWRRWWPQFSRQALRQKTRRPGRDFYKIEKFQKMF